jgi:hypothetical protein
MKVRTESMILRTKITEKVKLVGWFFERFIKINTKERKGYKLSS